VLGGYARKMAYVELTLPGEITVAQGDITHCYFDNDQSESKRTENP
jgi:hypothetical protein